MRESSPSLQWRTRLLAVILVCGFATPSLAQDAQDAPPPPSDGAKKDSPPKKTPPKAEKKEAPEATPPAAEPAAPPAAEPAAPPAAAPAAPPPPPPAAPQPPAIGSSVGGDDGLSLPTHPDTAAAKAAYNAGKYGEAIGHFRNLARRWPGNAAVYRALARACTWDSKPNDAINAYRAYLILLPDAADREKIQAELDLVLRKTKRPPKEGPPSRVKKALKQIDKRVQSGRLAGKKGAVAVYAKLMTGKYIGPALARGRDAIHTALLTGSKEAVSTWWSPTEKLSSRRLGTLVNGWIGLNEIDAPMPRGAEELVAAVTGLDHLVSGRFAEAVTTLAPVAPSDSRLRYAQALALMGAKRIDEAKQILGALARGDADPRVHLALGLIGGANGQQEGLDALHQALSHP